MKHLTAIEPVSQPYKGFWMAPAYRIPKGKFPVVDRFLSQETDTNTPITEIRPDKVFIGSCTNSISFPPPQ